MFVVSNKCLSQELNFCHKIQLLSQKNQMLVKRNKCFSPRRILFFLLNHTQLTYGPGGWLDQLRLKLSQSSIEVEVEV